MSGHKRAAVCQLCGLPWPCPDRFAEMEKQRARCQSMAQSSGRRCIRYARHGGKHCRDHEFSHKWDCKCQPGESWFC